MVTRWVGLGLETAQVGGEEGGQGEGKPTQRVVGLVGGLLGPGTRRWGVKSHPTSRWTRWVGLGVETARWGGEEGGQGEGEPTQQVKRLIGCRWRQRQGGVVSRRSHFRGSPMFSERSRTSHDFRNPFPPVSALITGFRNIFRIRFPQVMIHPNCFRATRLYLSVLWLFVLLLIILVANN